MQENWQLRSLHYRNRHWGNRDRTLVPSPFATHAQEAAIQAKSRSKLLIKIVKRFSLRLKQLLDNVEQQQVQNLFNCREASQG